MSQQALASFPSSPSFCHDRDLFPVRMDDHESRSHYRAFGIDRDHCLCDYLQLYHHLRRDEKSRDRLYPCIHALTSCHRGICHHHRVSFLSIEILHDSSAVSPDLLAALSLVICSVCALPSVEIEIEIVTLSSGGIPRWGIEGVDADQSRVNSVVGWPKKQRMQLHSGVNKIRHKRSVFPRSSRA